MSETSRSFFAVQIALDASKAQVDRAISMIRAAFGASVATDETDDAPTPATPATPAAAPAPATQVTPQEVADAELDADGLPWDERIHAGTKTKTQKGVWTLRKRVDDATREAVIAELRQQYPAAAVAADTPAPSPVPAAAPTVAAPAAPAISVPAAAPAPVTPYTELVDWLAKNTGDGKPLTKEWVEQQFAANNTSLAALAGNDDHSKAFLDAFKGALAQVGS